MPPGDICFVDYPRVNGHEQAGRRPSLVLQDDGFAGSSPLVVTIPFTTAARTLTRFPAVLPVPATATNGLAASSFLLVFQVRAIDRRRVDAVPIGTLDPATLSQVYDALDRLTGRPPPSPTPGQPPSLPPPSAPMQYHRGLDLPDPD